MLLGSQIWLTLHLKHCGRAEYLGRYAPCYYVCFIRLLGCLKMSLMLLAGPLRIGPLSRALQKLLNTSSLMAGTDCQRSAIRSDRTPLARAISAGHLDEIRVLKRHGSRGLFSKNLLHLLPVGQATAVCDLLGSEIQ